MPLDSDSAASTSTRGGADFDLLCTGAVQYYSFNLANLASKRTTRDIERELVKQLESTIRELELQSDRTIAQIYIGKTYIPRKNKRGGGFMRLDPLNHNTWKKEGISGRWGDHKKQDYGRDGMVVLCAITRDTVPGREMHQEDFTLDMEQYLIGHYWDDPRLANRTYNTGQRSSRYYAYALYMAFRYADVATTRRQKTTTASRTRYC